MNSIHKIKMFKRGISMKRMAVFFWILLAGWYLAAQNGQPQRPASALADTTQVRFAALAPEPQHRNVSQLVSQLLMRNHYQRKQIDDSLSSQIFDEYLKFLDFNRTYFLASDIKSLEAHRYMFDDYLLSGQVEQAYEIFNLYETRVAERLEHVFQLLNREFDFTIDEYLEVERENAPWPKTKAELDELWRKRLKNEALNLKLNGKDWNSIAETLRNRYKRIQKNVTQYQSEDVFQLLMNSLAESFDPHTNYFSPKDFDDFKIQMSQSLEGIGARLTTESDYTKVVEIVPGGPAEKSRQLFPNDRIIGVGQDMDGEIVDVIGWRIDDVVQLIRGKKSTVVRLQVLRSGAPANAPADTIALVRDKIKLEDRSAKSDTLQIIHQGKKLTLGIINIPSFYSDYEARRRGEKDYKSTSGDVKKLVEALEKQGVDGIVIDLRGNGGGFLDEAVELTGLFIDKGPVVQVRNAGGGVDVQWDTRPGKIYQGPLAVLVDRLSASASEIFAAAIQDYRRGIVIGSQSYGKGTVQNAFDLNRYYRNPAERLGQLKMTIAKFYRVNGGSTQHVGVIPDISFPSRFDKMEIGESVQRNALLWDRIDPVKFAPENDFSSLAKRLKQESNLRLGQNEEYKKLMENLAELEEQQNQTRISLQEAKRLAERNKVEKEDLLAEGETQDGAAADSAAIADARTPNHQGLKKDLLLKESGHILGDFLLLAKK